MARVTSQRTRQAVLVTGDPLDPNIVPEKLQLFNELGEPLMMGGGYARYEEDKSTAVLAVGASENYTLELYPSVRLWKIVTNRPARVRLYPTPAHMLADASRGLGVKPQGNHGRLLEVVTTTQFLELLLSPAVDITSVEAFDPNFYVNVTNLGPLAGAVEVTYHFFRTE